MTVGEYLRDAMREPWVWGGTHGLDCCKLMARWIMLRGWPDPMEQLRHAYDSEWSALRVIAEGGGLVALWSCEMARIGVSEADDARAGDVGIVEAPQEAGPDQACGIFTGERWAMLGVHGLVFARPDPVVVWRV